jgi:hypothetical protein
MAPPIYLAVNLPASDASADGDHFMEELAKLEERFLVAVEDVPRPSLERGELLLDLCGRAVVVATAAELAPRAWTACVAGLEVNASSCTKGSCDVVVTLQDGTDGRGVVVEVPHSAPGGACLGVWVERHNWVVKSLASGRLDSDSEDSTDGDETMEELLAFLMGQSEGEKNESVAQRGRT